REPTPSRNAVEAEVRRRFQRTAERQLEDLVDRYVKASGGVERLKQVIANRGLNWEEWRRRLERKAYTNTYLHEALSPLVPRDPRPADIRDYYQQHRDEFVVPGKVTFRHILFSVRERGSEDAARLAAENVYRAIAEGRLSFEEAARKHSDDPISRERGGLETDLAPEPERESWLQNIREAVRKEKPGEIGPILVSPLGCHLVMLVSVEPSQPQPFSEAQRLIAKRIFTQQWEEEVQKLYVALRAKTRVRILAERFPQELSCAAALSSRRGLPTIHVGPSAYPPTIGAAGASPSPLPVDRPQPSPPEAP
ncbi:MAG: peptidylprolyl isomerase, partial [Planctomycetota bacterium]|nr:peptidylprolyl isomerase [Planctomycetota bacterium]